MKEDFIIKRFREITKDGGMEKNRFLFYVAILKAILTDSSLTDNQRDVLKHYIEYFNSKNDKGTIFLDKEISFGELNNTHIGLCLNLVCTDISFIRFNIFYDNAYDKNIKEKQLNKLTKDINLLKELMKKYNILVRITE